MIRLYKSAESEVTFPMLVDDELAEKVGEEAIEKYRESGDPTVLGSVPASVLRVVVRPLTYSELLTLEESTPMLGSGHSAAWHKSRTNEADLTRSERMLMRDWEVYVNAINLAHVRRGAIRFEQHGKVITAEDLLDGVKDRHLLARIVSEAAGYVARVTRGPDPEGK